MNNSFAIVVLNQNTVDLAAKISATLPGAKVYGLANRTTGVDESFLEFGSTLRDLFTQGTSIIGICSAGILIRTLAPLLNNKWVEPPVLAIAPDGSAVVPLLGGLQGANELATTIAEALKVTAAITTSGKLRFETSLLSPPRGYYLANPENAKSFIADLLAGATVTKLGTAPWLEQSKLSFKTDAELKIIVSEKVIPSDCKCLVYHPQTIALAFDQGFKGDADYITAKIQEVFKQASLSVMSLGGVFTVQPNGDRTLDEVASSLGVPLRFLANSNLTSATEIALSVTQGSLIAAVEGMAIAFGDLPFDAEAIGYGRGKLTVVGTGPGGEKWLSPEVKEVLTQATDWVGYKTYLDLVEPLRKNQQRHESDNRVEIERASIALDLAATGRNVAVVSSGDPGIFAMAAAVFEALEEGNKQAWQGVEIKVCPGISAMQAAAAAVGAPLGHDFCVISLSDILKPWSVIEERIRAAAKADLVIAFYNPVSSKRTQQLERAKEILATVRSPETVVIIARNLGRKGSQIKIKSLKNLALEDADMRTVILVGSSTTRQVFQTPAQSWVYTPRYYKENF